MWVDQYAQTDVDGQIAGEQLGQLLAPLADRKPLEALPEVVQLQDQLEAFRVQLIAKARTYYDYRWNRHRASWADVGKALGVSGEAARKRYAAAVEQIHDEQEDSK